MSAEGRTRLSRPRTPVFLISGVNDPAMVAASLSMHLGLPGAVALRHTIDVDSGVLTRTVSDLTGVLERVEINLDHVCVSCAVREDIVPTLERLAAQARWDAIIACLPVTADASQVCRVLGWTPGNAPHVRIAAVLAALDGTTVTQDLLSDRLLAECDLATSADDWRGMAETACAMVEYADLVCLTEPPSATELGLVSALARPRVPVIADLSLLDAAALLPGVHQHPATEAWVNEARDGELPPLPEPAGAWRLDLRSDRPFHPERFSDELATLGRGPRRSRGCFWLPTRPRDICVWDCAGGQANVGRSQQWEFGRRRFTRIVVTGIDGTHDDRAEIEAAFTRCLLTDEELATRGWNWDDGWDGLEAWLGPIDRIA